MTTAANVLGLGKEQEQIERSVSRIIGEQEMPDQEARDLAGKALSRVDTHEVLCTERWNQQRIAMALVQNSLDTMAKNTVGRVAAGIIACLTGLCGFLADRAFPFH